MGGRQRLGRASLSVCLMGSLAQEAREHEFVGDMSHVLSK